MRQLIASLAALTLAACASTPRPVDPTPVPPRVAPVQRGDLIGSTVDELGARFGQPLFQVREGVGVKLQWARGPCVLDAFLYPPGNSGGGTLRVTYIDTRRPTGEPFDRATCVAALRAE